MKFVIKNAEGKYFKTKHKKGWWEDNLENARLYSRKCDASNSINYWKSPYSWYRKDPDLVKGLSTSTIVKIKVILEEIDV